MRPDLAIFHHFGKYLKIFGNLFKVYLVLEKVFSSLLHNFYGIGQNSIAENGQMLKTQSGHAVHNQAFSIIKMWKNNSAQS